MIIIKGDINMNIASVGSFFNSFAKPAQSVNISKPSASPETAGSIASAAPSTSGSSFSAVA